MNISRDLGRVLLLLLFVTGCGKRLNQEAEKMAVQTDAAKSLESLRSGDNAAYIAMVRAENETDLGFKVGGIVDIIGPAPGSDWNEGSAVKRGTILASLKQSDFVNALNSAKAQAELTTKRRRHKAALHAGLKPASFISSRACGTNDAPCRSDCCGRIHL